MLVTESALPVLDSNSLHTLEAFPGNNACIQCNVLPVHIKDATGNPMYLSRQLATTMIVHQKS